MKIEVLYHSSIRIWAESKVIYIDPFKIKEETHNADFIFVTHSHYDHFSEEDIKKIKKEDTKISITTDLLDRTIELGFNKDNILIVEPNNSYNLLNIKFNTIPAYNTNKEFHPKGNNWVGYLLDIEDKMIYIAGDTDITDENKDVKCDIALVPIGGTYTMTDKEAAELINIIKPQLTIPTHYGGIVGKKEDGIKFQDLINKEIEVEIQL